LLQPVLSRKGTGVRGQIQDNDRDRKDGRETERGHIGINSREFNQVTADTPPKGRDRARNEEEG
jgi:hypothetical protein